MKKLIALLLCAGCVLLSGCAQKDQKDAQTASTDVPVETDAPAETQSASEVSSAADTSEEIDLTQMGSTMVYSYVYSMVSEPDSFIGQRFRLSGTYGESYWEETDTTYHFVLISDATACCAQGLEFVLTDEAAAYPVEGDEVEISGLFELYEEEGSLYIHIVADQMTIIDA